MRPSHFGYRFLSPKHIKAWLRYHPEGQKILDELGDTEMLEETIHPPIKGKLLVVRFKDRIEVYSDIELLVKEVVAVDCERQEEIIDSVLPKKWSEMYAGGQKVGEFSPIHVTIGKYEDMTLVRALTVQAIDGNLNDMKDVLLTTL